MIKQSFPNAGDEASRLEMLQQLEILDTPPEAAFDELTKLAALTCQAPIAMLAFVDDRREWLKSKIGVETQELTRDLSLSNIVLSSGSMVLVEDTAIDRSLSECALVSSQPKIRFYVGLPIAPETGQIVGVLSVSDIAARSLSSEQLEALHLLAHHVERLLAMRRSFNGLKDSTSIESQEIAGLRESQRALKTLISNLPGVAYRAKNDKCWSIELISDGCLQLMGYPASDLTEGRINFIDIAHPDDVSRLKREMSKALRKHAPFQFTYRIKIPGGGIKWVWEQGRGVYSSEGNVLALEGFITDITELRKAEEKIRQMAYYDKLTNLPNRLLLSESLDIEISAATSQNESFALLHIEIGSFRKINESLGYREGDRLLQEVATRLRVVKNEGATIAHIAESSFAFLIPKADASRAGQAAKNILNTLSEPLELSGLLLDADPSIGISLFPGHGNDPDSLLRRANVAHYQARSANSRVAIYSGALDIENNQRLTLMTDLRRAIECGELLLLYQPKLEVIAGKVCGAEALVRWRHRKHGMVPPDQFIKFAENAGLITRLTYWVLNAALRESYAWHNSGYSVPIAVNLSSRDLRDPNLLVHIQDSLATWGAQPTWIQFELTESCLMEDFSTSQKALEQLHNLGFKIFIDDFGTGYSSLSYLRKLPIDYIKIDQSFVTNIENDEDSSVIVRSTIDLAHNLGLEVVAEGVESQAIMELLADWGCEQAQGYCISKPIPGSEFQEWHRGFCVANRT